MNCSLSTYSSILIKKGPFLFVISFQYLHYIEFVMSKLIIWYICKVQCSTKVLIHVPVFSSSICINSKSLLFICFTSFAHSRLKFFLKDIMIFIIIIWTWMLRTFIFIWNSHLFIELIFRIIMIMFGSIRIFTRAQHWDKN